VGQTTIKKCNLQGGLDPKTLLLSDEVIQERSSKYFNVFQNTPYIFNLGHGFAPRDRS
jgi:uroporphyrinogen-III decarboxylase